MGGGVELIYLRTRPQSNRGYIFFQVIFHENLSVGCARKTPKGRHPNPNHLSRRLSTRRSSGFTLVSELPLDDCSPHPIAKAEPNHSGGKLILAACIHELFLYFIFIGLSYSRPRSGLLLFFLCFP